MHPNFSKTLRSASYRGVRLGGLLYTAESSSAVCIILWSQAPQCTSHRGVRSEIFESLWLLLEGEILVGVNTSTVSWKKRFEENIFWFAKPKIWLRGVMHTAESTFSNYVIEYLDEIETEFENTWPCFSGAQMGSDYRKKWRSKISWHTPRLKKLNAIFIFAKILANKFALQKQLTRILGPRRHRVLRLK